VSATLTGFLNTLPWAVYNATPTPRTEGQGGPLQADANGNLKSTLQSYDSASGGNKEIDIAPLNQQFVAEDQIDTTNVGAATNYYPSSSGLSMDGYSGVAIQANTAGGVTTTIEVTLHGAASPTWIDITDSCYNWVLGGVRYNTSFVDVPFLLFLENLNVKAIRIKSITSDATNTVVYSMRRIY
jgi:hypothetical protein